MKFDAQPTVYKLFKGQTSEQELFVAGHGTGRCVCVKMHHLTTMRGSGAPPIIRIVAHSFSILCPFQRCNSSSADEFYSLLYLGLYCEVRGEVAKASNYLQQSLRTSYVMTSRGSTDYMTDVARVRFVLFCFDGLEFAEYVYLYDE